MKILIACEESQTVCKAFRAKGHDAYSCDLLACSGGRPEWHIKGDALRALMCDSWDMVLFFPDCTYITCSAEWAYKSPPYHQKVKAGTLTGPARIAARNAALQFICDMLNACERKGIKKFGFENPVGVIPKRIFKYYDEQTGLNCWRVFLSQLQHGALEATQYIQPYEFGEDASKKTGLWLFGLPALVSTKLIRARVVNGRELFANQTGSGQNKLPPSPDRAKLRSKTYQGIAEAMAEQWG